MNSQQKSEKKKECLATIVSIQSNGSYTVKMCDDGGDYANLVAGVSAMPDAIFAVGEKVWLSYQDSNPIIRVQNNENSKQYGFAQAIPFEFLYFGMVKN